MATVIDLSGLNYLLPIFSFLLVFVVAYAVLLKTKIVGDSNYTQLFTAFLIATVFVLALKPRDFILSIVPWFAIIIVMAFFILALTGFVGESGKKLGEGISKGLIVALLVLFVISAFFVFSDYYAPYLPGGSGGNSNISGFFSWFYNSRIFGGVILILISLIVSWVLVKAAPVVAGKK
jgi:hypothetical protein